MAFLRIPTERPVRWIFGFAGILCTLGDVSGQESNMSDLARAEVSRRGQAAMEAQQLLINGDKAYEAGRYADAVEAYRGAIDLLPENAPAVAAQREAALQRFSQASVERARKLRRLGDLEGAQQVIDGVLDEKVSPDDPAALAMEQQLLDPIRTNPASSLEHTGNIEEVRLLLYKADGAYELGKFDEARAVYQDVLRVDPYNSAARRGMERTDAARSSYHRAAYDQTRSEMLAEVDRQWELPVPPEMALRGGGGLAGAGGVVDYADKLESITVPVAILEDVTLPEAVDFLRQQSIENDKLELDPLERGVNFVIDVGGVDSETGKALRERTFSLNLRGATLGQLVDYVAESTRTQAIRQPFAVTFRPLGADSEQLVSRTYRVPPDFLTNSAFDDDGGGQADFDPFAPKQEDGGLMGKRLTAEEKLKKLGVPFPDGATAAFYAGTSTLQVRNTPLNHSLVEQIVDTIASEEPTSVVVEVTILRTQQDTLEELGFDWILSPFGLSANSVFLGGGTIGSGSARTASDFISPVNFTAIPGVPIAAGQNVENIMTGGLRSGDFGSGGNSIDSILNNPTRQTQSSSVAPGILSFTGLFTDGQVQMIVRGLDQKKGSDVVAVPSVTTRSGQQSSIEIIREFIYPTEYEPPELPNSVGTNSEGIFPVTPATPTAFDMRKVGVILEVLPTASKDKRFVDINLKPNLTDFDGFINYGSPIRSGGAIAGGAGFFGQVEPQVVTNNEILMPVFSKMATETALTVADGTTMVIGGLLEERTENYEDKVPILGDIPVLGRLFQSKGTSSVSKAVIFLVKVRVVDAAGRPFNP
ncbi:Amuc_1098 family type IV pilus outer membrane protein [Haloferula sp. A504]|uniref:Amuc_1098 family type IV pilus outer membrane protein n=1 Tax=Haloferula sp. A504 TaxID=3373601 RepID=UPI0031C9198A|nr:hypothetical protein [Verrucomicrobiaceae bacterium E54]